MPKQCLCMVHGTDIPVKVYDQHGTTTARSMEQWYTANKHNAYVHHVNLHEFCTMLAERCLPVTLRHVSRLH
jgi:Golgi nucleoside diphosphatase